MQYLVPLLISGIVFIFGVFLYIKSHKDHQAALERETSLNRRMYELAILKELGDRIGYSLDVHQIVDIITGSLHQFIEYSAVSYMIIQPEKVLFKIHLEKSVHRKFINEIKERMLGSLSALLDNKELDKKPIEEILSGAILIEEVEDPIRSFFNIPIVIGNTVAGVLTVADTKVGLYKEEDMTILYKITQQASNAVTKLQEVVENEERKLNSMVESITEGVVMTDNDYRLVVANPAAQNIIGVNNKKDLSIFDFIDSLKDKVNLRDKLEESVKLNKNVQVNDIMIQEKFFQIFFSPVKSSSGPKIGETLGGVIIFHDITHEKEIESLRKDFTSMMVHELRSPLDGIQKIADLLIRKHTKLPQKEIYKEYLPIIQKSSSDMLNLVNKLLDTAKIESGKYEIFKTPNNINDIIATRIKFYESAVIASGQKISSLFSKNLPEKVPVDAEAFSSILNNLISNAMRYNKPAGEIFVQAFPHSMGKNIIAEAKNANMKWLVQNDDANFSILPDSIIVAITDTGIGIKKENIPQLFNKFKQFQHSAVAADKKGSGLGLVISKGLIEAHGGKIGVASEEGLGTTFYFSIPV